MTKQVHVPPYLTQEEVNALPDGTRVIITWPNGNGPWEYVIEKPFGMTMVATVEAGSIPHGHIYCVGDKKHHTLVTLAQ